MKKFKVTLKSDSGPVHITTYARDQYQAKQIVCECEGCPQYAVKSIKQLN